ncbi:ATP-binding protein [Kiloniella sp. b19]|uniref:ATP-binding protein n=1 Tax=Kiloniella sp. GXU_MW_B19 TaxID=3141326 RepID=UPI0031CF9BC5
MTTTASEQGSASAREDHSREPMRDYNGQLIQQGFWKRVLPRTLLGRSLMIIVLPVLLVQAISAWVFYDRHYETVTKRLTNALAGDLAIAITLLEDAQSPSEQAEIFRLLQRTASLSLSFHEGAVLLDDSWKPGWSILENRLDNALRSSLHSHRQTGYLYSIDTKSLDDQIKIEIEMDTGVLLALVPSKRLFTTTTYLVTFWMLGTSFFFFGIAVLFMRNQVRPIQRLAQAAEAFGKGHDVSGFKPEGASEVRLASAAFLRMGSRIKRQVENRTAMLAGVSHDLRTPLTRMKLQLALMGDKEGISELKDDVAEMETMIEGYLSFARGDRGEDYSDVSLRLFLEDVVAPFRRSALQEQAALQRDECDKVDLLVQGDALLHIRRNSLKRAISNLIGNARRYADNLSVQANMRAGQVEIIVDDDGPGIPQDKRKDVLKPFFRLEASRNSDTGGQGLGLSITMDIISNHGGELKLEDSPMGGLRARVTLPL